MRLLRVRAKTERASCANKRPMTALEAGHGSGQVADDEAVWGRGFFVYSAHAVGIMSLPTGWL